MGWGTIIIVGGLLCWIFTCWAILDIAGKNFESIQIKFLWGCIAFIPFIGFLIYLVYGRKKGVKKGSAPAADPQ